MNSRQLCLTAVLAGCLPGVVQACETLTSRFDICAEGTPWADGVWESAGDTATLHLDDIAYEGFADYIGSGQDTSLQGALDLLQSETAQDRLRKPQIQDAFSTADLAVVRSIDLETIGTEAPRLKAMMIAQAPDTARIALIVTAPAGTDPGRMDRLTRDYAALVRRNKEGT